MLSINFVNNWFNQTLISCTGCPHSTDVSTGPGYAIGFSRPCLYKSKLYCALLFFVNKKLHYYNNFYCILLNITDSHIMGWVHKASLLVPRLHCYLRVKGCMSLQHSRLPVYNKTNTMVCCYCYTRLAMKQSILLWLHKTSHVTMHIAIVTQG